MDKKEFCVLCVDDDMAILGMLGTVLRHAGYGVRLAESGAVALQKLYKDPNQFQLVITDIRMPGLDGFGVIRQARILGYTGPFVVFAGMMSSDDREQMKELGVEHIIAKPASGTVVIGAIRDALTLV